MEEWSHTFLKMGKQSKKSKKYFWFCSHKVMPQGTSSQPRARRNSCPFQDVLNPEIGRHKTTIHLPNNSRRGWFFQHAPFPEAHGANSASVNPRRGRQVLCPGTVIPALWLPRNVSVHDLICKSSWGYRPGQSRWNSALWPLSGISSNALTELRKPVTMSGSPRRQHWNPG